MGRLETLAIVGGLGYLLVRNMPSGVIPIAPSVTPSVVAPSMVQPITEMKVAPWGYEYNSAGQLVYGSYDGFKLTKHEGAWYLEGARGPASEAMPLSRYLELKGGAYKISW